MKLSVFTAMVVDGRVFDGSGRKLPPAEAVEAIAEAGYEGIEWGIAEGYALTPSMAEPRRAEEELGKLCHDRGLEIVSIATGAAARRTPRRRSGKSLEIAARVSKSPMMRVDLRLLRLGRVVFSAGRAKRGRFRRARSEAARSYKIKLLVEIHFGLLSARAGEPRPAFFVTLRQQRCRRGDLRSGEHGGRRPRRVADRRRGARRLPRPRARQKPAMVVDQAGLARTPDGP